MYKQEEEFLHKVAVENIFSLETIQSCYVKFKKKVEESALPINVKQKLFKAMVQFSSQAGMSLSHCVKYYVPDISKQGGNEKEESDDNKVGIGGIYCRGQDLTAKAITDFLKENMKPESALMVIPSKFQTKHNPTAHQMICTGEIVFLNKSGSLKITFETNGNAIGEELCDLVRGIMI